MKGFKLSQTDTKTLQKLLNKGPDKGFESIGVCAYINLLPSTKDREEIFSKWEHYSGSPIYPVPNPSYPKNPAEAEDIYNEFSSYDLNMYDRRKNYGKMRMALIEFLIKEYGYWS